MSTDQLPGAPDLRPRYLLVLVLCSLPIWSVPVLAFGHWPGWVG
ncbi:hypothetical protein MYFR107205_29990 [Mycolicibacterium frederiksbergense]|nr:hypothetical protein [Mycolicibacterium frederiksbergense]